MQTSQKQSSGIPLNFPKTGLVTVHDLSLGRSQCYHNALARKMVLGGKATWPATQKQ